MVGQIVNLAKAERERATKDARRRRLPPPLPKRAPPGAPAFPPVASFPRPIPQLVLPIVAPASPHSFSERSATQRSPLPPLTAPAPLRVAPQSFRPEILPPYFASPPSPFALLAHFRLRQPSSRLLDVFGFALAWLLTVGAAGTVVGHVIARSQLPAVVWLPFNPTAGTPAAAPVSCTQPWQPVIAVSDLPRAVGSRGFYGPAQRPPATAIRQQARASDVGQGPASEAPAPTRPTKAAETRKTLGDWMHDAVGPT
jgi:hypothetical protein